MTDGTLIEADEKGYVIIDEFTYRICGPLKSPFRQQNYGLRGAMVASTDGAQILCHECGELRANLHAHLRYMHKMTSDEYREKYSLLKRNPLISPKLSEIRREHGLNRRIKLWMMNRVPGDNLKSKNNRGSLRSAEKRNRSGNCDDQNREKLIQLAQKYNTTPEGLRANHHTRPDVHILAVNFRIRYGSWSAGKRILLSGSHRRFAYTHNDIIRMVKTWAKQHKRFPFYSDFKRGDHGLPTDMTIDKYFGNLNNLRTILGWPVVKVGWARHQRGERVWNKTDWDNLSTKIFQAMEEHVERKND